MPEADHQLAMTGLVEQRPKLLTQLGLLDGLVDEVGANPEQVDAFCEEDRSLAAIFAAHADVALRTAREREQLRRAIDSRDVIPRFCR